MKLWIVHARETKAAQQDPIWQLNGLSTDDYIQYSHAALTVVVVAPFLPALFCICRPLVQTCLWRLGASREIGLRSFLFRASPQELGRELATSKCVLGTIGVRIVMEADELQEGGQVEASVFKTQVKPAWSGSAAQEALLKEAWLQVSWHWVLQLQVACFPPSRLGVVNRELQFEPSLWQRRRQLGPTWIVDAACT